MKVWNPSFFARNFSKHDPRFKTKSSDRMSHPLSFGYSELRPRYCAVDFWTPGMIAKKTPMVLNTLENPTQKMNECPFLKGPFQKEISSSNHWFFRGYFSFPGESYCYGFWSQLSLVFFFVKCWHFNCTLQPGNVHSFLTQTFRQTMKKCLKSNSNSDHLGQLVFLLKKVTILWGLKWGEKKPTIEGEKHPIFTTTRVVSTPRWASSKEVSEGFGVALGASLWVTTRSMEVRFKNAVFYAP